MEIASPHQRQMLRLLTIIGLAILLIVAVSPVFAQPVQIQPVDLPVEATPTADLSQVEPPTRLIQEPPSSPEDTGADLADIPSDEIEGTPPADFEVQPEPGAILAVYTWACPAGFVLDTLANAQLDCTTPLDGVVVDLDAADASEADLQGVTASGFVYFNDVVPGTWAMQPQVPTGYTDPAILYCDDLYDPAAAEPILQGGAYHEVDLAPEGFLECHWIFVLDTDHHTVRVTKAVCPAGTDPTLDYWMLAEACPTTLAGVTFALSTESGDGSQATDGSGRTEWTNVDLGASGALSLAETIPAGYGEPTVWCVDYPVAAADPIDYVWFPVATVGGATGSLVPEQHEPFIFGCTFFNHEGGDDGYDTSLTLHKWTCPPGFDPTALWAEPLLDCTVATDGVEFSIFNEPTAQSHVAVTGDGGTGTVAFTDLMPGEWVVSETVPAGTMKVFILPCTGFAQQPLQPVLLEGPDLNVTMYDGDHVICNWFNVPEGDGGTVDLTKYICATETFVAEVDCQIEEGGVTFDLIDQDGNVVATATTDGTGRITWSGLAAGDYWLAEHGQTWCRIQASPAEGGDTFGVNPGAVSMVKVWNCGAEPGKPGDTPSTFPNTGVPTAQSLSSLAEGDGERLLLIPRWLMFVVIVFVIGIAIVRRSQGDDAGERGGGMWYPLNHDTGTWPSATSHSAGGDAGSWRDAGGQVDVASGDFGGGGDFDSTP